MSDTCLSLAAAAVELGYPLLLLILMKLLPRFRAKLIVALGAVFPMAVLYIASAVSYLITPRTPSSMFAFFAMWVMTFGPYIAIAVGGILLALMQRPRNMVGRFFLGVLSAPCSFGLLALATSF